MKQIDTFLVTQKMLNRCVLQKQHQLKEQPPSKRMEFHGVLVAQDQSGTHLLGSCRFSVSRVGQNLSMKQVYERHHVGRRFIEQNYKSILLKLEQEGKISANPSKRRKNTFADNVVVTFPKRS